MEAPASPLRIPTSIITSSKSCPNLNVHPILGECLSLTGNNIKGVHDDLLPKAKIKEIAKIFRRQNLTCM